MVNQNISIAILISPLFNQSIHKAGRDGVIVNGFDGIVVSLLPVGVLSFFSIAESDYARQQ